MRIERDAWSVTRTLGTPKEPVGPGREAARSEVWSRRHALWLKRQAPGASCPTLRAGSVYWT